VSYSANGISFDASPWEVADEVEGVAVDETVTAIVVVVVVEDLHRRMENLGYAVGQNWLGWAVGPNSVSCGGSEVPGQDSLGLCFSEGGQTSDKDL
jgi:hypothetical protein